jgi:hypothetical protein
MPAPRDAALETPSNSAHIMHALQRSPHAAGSWAATGGEAVVRHPSAHLDALAALRAGLVNVPRVGARVEALPRHRAGTQGAHPAANRSHGVVTEVACRLGVAAHALTQHLKANLETRRSRRCKVETLQC